MYFYQKCVKYAVLVKNIGNAIDNTMPKVLKLLFGSHYFIILLMPVGHGVSGRVKYTSYKKKEVPHANI